MGFKCWQFADGAKMPDLQAVGQQLDDDAADAILQQCSEISERLKNALQSHSQNRSGIPL